MARRFADNDDKRSTYSKRKAAGCNNSEGYKVKYTKDKKEEKKSHRALKIIGKILLILIIILAILMGVAFWYINDKLGKINTETIDIEKVGIAEETKEELAGYRNVALLGIDSREDDYGLGNRSDCIIIASINQKTKDVKLISIYRDTYMQVEELGTKKLDKVTHAYSYGGAQNTLKSLNTNLDLNITEYVTVNFDAVIAAVDAIGGISINIDSSELEYINSYIDATSESSGIKSRHITKTGTQTLDGVQAIAYSRIRYTAGGDYKRTERMRTVVTAMLNKAKTLSIAQLNTFADTILPKIKTNISSSEIWGLIPSIDSFKVSGSIGWPYDTEGITLDRWYGVPVTLEKNVERLHKEVFEQADYEVSDDVKNISNQIIKKTGYK